MMNCNIVQAVQLKKHLKSEMNRMNNIYKFWMLVSSLLIVVGLIGCTDQIDNLTVDDGEGIKEGEAVQFVAVVPKTKTTRATNRENFNALINTYKPVEADYVFTVRMFEDNKAAAIAETNYIPTTRKENSQTIYDSEGFLTHKEGSHPLYWHSSTAKYAFEAVAGEPESASSTVSEDQGTDELFLGQDYIKGYGFVPAWDSELEAAKYKVDGANYLTSKEWYAANKSLGNPPVGYGTEFYKSIPLYLRHQRARISIILRAGEGVERTHLVAAPDNRQQPARDNILMKIHSYQEGADASTDIKPLLLSQELDYTPNVQNDPENTVYTARYDAIVEPYDYSAHIDSKIASIAVSGMKFSFSALNDELYARYLNTSSGAEKASLLAQFEERYNLKAGQHLIITATLSTADRKVLITAYVEDWVDYPFVTVCDDYGQNGKPTEIHNKQELIDFLTDESKNRSGNVAVIVPSVLDLEEDLGTQDAPIPNAWGNKPGDNTPMNYKLNAVLNLTGATIRTSHPIFTEIGSSGKIVNGAVVVGGNVECAVAQTNAGNIERITVTANNGAKASRAGIATNNTGNIYKCTSALPVNGTGATFVGGIAAISEYATGESASMPVIDQCVVTARVAGVSGDKGGGIVGKGTGQITNNTFEYGITLSQNQSGTINFRNIVHTTGDRYDSQYVHNNEWSTKDENTPDGQGGAKLENARPVGLLYDNVIDCQDELKMLVTSNTYNSDGKTYRIADSFTVTPTNWVQNDQAIGRQENNLGSNYAGNVLFKLDGNDKVITLNGDDVGDAHKPAPMLFTNVQGEIYDLTIYCADDVTVAKNENNTDAVAPLAYSVTGSTARLSNIKVKMASGKKVEASAPAGMVVWAYGSATIEDCHSNAVIVNHAVGGGDQQTYFAGGIVNTAAKAYIKRCTYHTKALDAPSAGTVYVGGIVGGTNTKSINNVDETPSLEISDCTSWLTWSDDTNDSYKNFGGIIGYTLYGLTTDLINGMRDCQGNYWVAPRPYGRGKAGMKEEDIIGKKNGVAPEPDNNYGNL